MKVTGSEDAIGLDVDAGRSDSKLTLGSGEDNGLALGSGEMDVRQVSHDLAGKASSWVWLTRSSSRNESALAEKAIVSVPWRMRNPSKVA